MKVRWRNVKVYSKESDKIISYCRERQGDRIRNVLTGNHGLTTEKRMGKLPSLQKLYKSITAHFQGEMCLLSIIMFVLHTNKEYPADFWLCRSPSSMLGSQKCLVCPQRERLVGCFSPCTWRGTQDVGLGLLYGLSHLRKSFILKTAITNVMWLESIFVYTYLLFTIGKDSWCIRTH